MLNAALFTIVRTGKQSQHPSTDDWIKDIIYTMEYYSVIKSEFESVLVREMNIEPLIQSEVSQ